jgi:hypothetical protein
LPSRKRTLARLPRMNGYPDASRPRVQTLSAANMCTKLSCTRRVPSLAGAFMPLAKRQMWLLVAVAGFYLPASVAQMAPSAQSGSTATTTRRLPIMDSPNRAIESGPGERGTNTRTVRGTCPGPQCMEVTRPGRPPPPPASGPRQMPSLRDYEVGSEVTVPTDSSCPGPRCMDRPPRDSPPPAPAPGPKQKPAKPGPN